jgi:hypothetical protein
MTVGTGHHMQYKAKQVYSADAKRLGQIFAITADYFLVQRGILFSRVCCLPTRFLVRSDMDRAYLSATHAEIQRHMRRELPPEGDAWYADESSVEPSFAENARRLSHTDR